MWPSYSSLCQRPRNDLTVGRYEDVIKIMKATICASSSSKTRGGFSETGSHMLSSGGISDGAPNPWKHTVSLGNGGLSSHSCINSVAQSTVSIGDAGLRSMLPTIEKVKYSGVKRSYPTQSYTVPTWPLFGNLHVITPSVICLINTFTCNSLMSGSACTARVIHRDKSLQMLNWLPISYINKRRLLVHCILNDKVLYPPFNLKLGNRSSGKGRVTD